LFKMRTSTLLAVLAALMLLVACAAPVLGQSSSSSTGASSSSSSAAIIASSSSSTGSSGNATAASSSGASSSSTAGNSNDFSFLLVFPGYSTAALNAQSNATTVIQQEILALLGGVGNVIVGTTGDTNTAFTDYPSGGTYTAVTIIQAASNALTLIENGKGSQAFISQANIVDPNNKPGSASTLSFGFAAVAVVLAALLQ